MDAEQRVRVRVLADMQHAVEQVVARTRAEWPSLSLDDIIDVLSNVESTLDVEQYGPDDDDEDDR